jgi:hypothetical protein
LIKQKGNVMREVKIFVTAFILISLYVPYVNASEGPNVEMKDISKARNQSPPPQDRDLNDRNPGNNGHTQAKEDRINEVLAFYGLLFH